MTQQQEMALAELRALGYAVVIFTPEDVEGISVDRLASRLVSDAYEHIDDLRELAANMEAVTGE